MNIFNRGRFAMVALAVLAISTVACVPGGDSPSSPSPARGATRSESAPIEKLDVLIRESSPPGYTLQITSGLPSGCAKFEAATITGRTGNVLTVRVTNTVPADPNVACTDIYGYQETNLDLGQDFRSGQQYTVKANDKETTFTAQ